MKDEKKTKSRTIYRIGICSFMAVVLLTLTLTLMSTVSLHAAGHDQEKPLFTGNYKLFNHYGNDNGLFSQAYRSGGLSGPGVGRGSMLSQAQIEPIKDKPRLSTGKLFGEIFLGMVGNVVCGYGSAFIGAQITKQNDGAMFDGFGGAILGGFTGSTFGSALGVYLSGNSGNTKGSFGSALLGSLLGEGAAVLVSLLTRNGTVAAISFVTLPPIGAALLFNSSLRYKSLPGSNALLNFNKGDIKIGIPHVRIQPLPLPGYAYKVKVKRTVKFNINLLNIVF